MTLINQYAVYMPRVYVCMDLSCIVYTSVCAYIFFTDQDPQVYVCMYLCMYTGINKGESGPMLRASFEETVEVNIDV